MALPAATTIFGRMPSTAAGGLALSATSPRSFDWTGPRSLLSKKDLTATTFTQSYFHVLAPRIGDGVDSTNLQSVTSTTKQITSGFSASSPGTGSGAVTDLALVPVSGTASDTFSSPFVDYNNDTAYIGNDSGTLFRVMNVFCTLAACTGGGSPAPSLDTTWGNGTGALATGCSKALTGAVVAGNGNVFVGCSDGTLLWGSPLPGVAISHSPLTVGDGTIFGGIVDPPLVDVVNGFVYVVGRSSFRRYWNILQFWSKPVRRALLTSLPVVATLGVGGQFNLHTPAFNDAYFSSSFSSVSNVQGTVNPPANGPTGSTSNWQIYEWGNTGVSTSPTALYGVGFNGSHVMTAGPASNFVQVTGRA